LKNSPKYHATEIFAGSQFGEIIPTRDTAMHKRDTSAENGSLAKELVAPALFLAGLFTLVALISALG
jgi:hypothetical protein